MKAILFLFYVAILPLIIHGNTELLKKQLEKMASKHKSINGIFQPANCGFLGEGLYGSVFKGKIINPNEKEVAMKFTPLLHGATAQKEYEMYTYLGAINNTDVECYGIPAVYYYGKWEDYILMAITLLDSEFEKRFDKETLKDVDILIIAREFVKISKYIHSRGIFHSDIKFDNIMFRKQRAFIIDFNRATRLHRNTEWPEFGIPPTNVYQDKRHLASQEWASFLEALCSYYNVSYGWFENFSKLRKEDPNYRIELKNKIPSENNPFAKEEFRQVFGEFSRYIDKLAVFKAHKKRWQLYDDLHRIISAKIDNLNLPKPVFVSWLTDEERRKAKDELNSKQLPDISSIEDRFANVHAEYPEVNYDYYGGIE